MVVGVSTLPPMTHLLVHNGHYSCAESHSNNHDTDEVLVKADGLDHCYHKDDQCIDVALPLVFWCVKLDKLDDESVIEGNKHISHPPLCHCTVLLFYPFSCVIPYLICLVQFHILLTSMHTHLSSFSLPMFTGTQLTSISVGSQMSIDR